MKASQCRDIFLPSFFILSIWIQFSSELLRDQHGNQFICVTRGQGNTSQPNFLLLNYLYIGQSMKFHLSDVTCQYQWRDRPISVAWQRLKKSLFESKLQPAAATHRCGIVEESNYIFYRIVTGILFSWPFTYMYIARPTGRTVVYRYYTISPR